MRVPFEPVNLRDLARLPAESEVTQQSLLEAGVIDNSRLPVKVLATGDVSGAYTVRVHRVSAAARAKIEAAGGSVEELQPREKKVRNRKHRRTPATPPPADEASTESEKEEDGSSSETGESSSAD
jgi:hypothetical protein